ncbi:hypothetical protein QTG54_011082 [Skeletonema marinoi]|uniref:Large ribosomal subunit protein uL15/eL18 domain-containing protein n=1 Tax=Skeletonema marinoi TaxID=267567 RepID=A0AAD8Y2M7_9STRA|nr:hypothetical protein QTG54_011082 [Skeletonema marinoi]
MRDFVKAGMFPASSIKSGVKLLGDGKTFVKDKLLIEVPWASASAIAAIEAKGGYVTTVHYNRLALRAHLKPHKFPTKPKAARAPEGEGSMISTCYPRGHVHLPSICSIILIMRRGDT